MIEAAVPACRPWKGQRSLQRQRLFTRGKHWRQLPGVVADSPQRSDCATFYWTTSGTLYCDCAASLQTWLGALWVNNRFSLTHSGVAPHLCSASLPGTPRSGPASPEPRQRRRWASPCRTCWGHPDRTETSPREQVLKALVFCKRVLRRSRTGKSLLMSTLIILINKRGTKE